MFAQVIFLFEVLNPRMVKDLDQGKSFSSLVNQYLIHQIFVIVTQTWLEPNLAPHDLVADFSRMHTSKGSPTMNQLIEQDTKRPYIQRMVMIFVLDHFGCHVLESTTKGVPLLHMVRLNTPSEITDLDNVAFFNQDVLRFDISVDKTLLVHVVYSTAYLNEEVKCRVFSQELLFPDKIEQVSLASIFKC